jgi:uncharacterized protein (TIGR03083 family)
MDTYDLIGVLDREGRRLADTAAGVAVDTPVPTCPGWVLRDLLLHTSGVHRWAETTVRERHTEIIPLDNAQDIEPTLPSDDELVDWFRAGHAALVDTLSQAPDDLVCVTFMRTAPTPKAFWARRQAHETAVHRLDAEAAAGTTTSTGVELAADGIDELLTGFVPRNRKLRTDSPRTLRFETTDIGHGWVVTVSAERPQVVRADEYDGPADVTVLAEAEDLYRTLWNRQDWSRSAITGDAGLLDRWSADVRVRWS